MKVALWVCWAALAALGCASPPSPRADVARAQAALEEAERGGGAEHAELEMSLAREKLAAAEKSSEAGDATLARRSAEQAEVDARLALAKARRAEAETAYDELEQTIRALQEEVRDDVP